MCCILKILYGCVDPSTVVIMICLKCLSRLQHKPTCLELFSNIVGSTFRPYSRVEICWPYIIVDDREKYNNENFLI